MNTRVVVQVVAVTALMVLTVAAGFAQGPVEEGPAGQVSGSVASSMALSSAIGYQGQIELGGAPVNGSCDFEFSLWTAASGPAQVGSTQARAGVAVDDGLFMVDGLDFGDGAFNGDPRWLQIAVRCPAGTGGYTTLSPRATVRSAPYALYAGNSDRLDGVDAGGFVSTSGGTLAGNLVFQGAPLYHDWEIGQEGYWSPGQPAIGWFYVKDLSDAEQPLRLLIKDDTGDVAIAHNLGVGTDVPAKRLHVVGDSQFDGLAQFNLGGGSIAMSTPEGQPGMIAVAQNGHRRDIKFTNSLLQLLANTSSGIPSNTSGINILEGGNVGIGTTTPAKRLHVAGESQFDGISTFAIGGGSFSITTPGGWPGLIAYAPNGHRREVSFKDDRMQILVSTSNAASPNDNGINIYESGTVGVKVLQITGGSDLAEPFEVAGSRAAEPGMVVAIDAEHPGQLRLADAAYDRKVAGCVSGAKGIQPGLTMQQEGSEASGAVPVALTGRAYCWADARYGAIEPGDLLTTSQTPGHAMVATDSQRSQGAIIGKAMTPLADGRGLVLVLISLQ